MPVQSLYCMRQGYDPLTSKNIVDTIVDCAELSRGFNPDFLYDCMKKAPLSMKETDTMFTALARGWLNRNVMRDDMHGANDYVEVGNMISQKVYGKPALSITPTGIEVAPLLQSDPLTN